MKKWAFLAKQKIPCQAILQVSDFKKSTLHHKFANESFMGALHNAKYANRLPFLCFILF